MNKQLTLELECVHHWFIEDALPGEERIQRCLKCGDVMKIRSLHEEVEELFLIEQARKMGGGNKKRIYGINMIRDSMERGRIKSVEGRKIAGIKNAQ